MAEKKRTRQPNGASTIYLGKDGKWHGRVTVGVRDDGKPDRRHIERKTKAEVTKAVREMERGRARYMHVTGTMLRKVAQQVGDALWELPKTN